MLIVGIFYCLILCIKIEPLLSTFLPQLIVELSQKNNKSFGGYLKNHLNIQNRLQLETQKSEHQLSLFLINTIIELRHKNNQSFVGELKNPLNIQSIFLNSEN
jgi:hypothetical protein